MSDSARLFIIERLLPERSSDDPAAAMIDMHMMVINGGKCRSLTELDALLTAARLAPVKTTPTTSGLAVIESIRN